VSGSFTPIFVAAEENSSSKGDCLCELSRWEGQSSTQFDRDTYLLYVAVVQKQVAIHKRMRGNQGGAGLEACSTMNSTIFENVDPFNE
jgi:hypothetical protein